MRAIKTIELVNIEQLNDFEEVIAPSEFWWGVGIGIGIGVAFT